MSVKGEYPIPAKYGDRVRWRRSTTGSPTLEIEGEGVFFLAWCGVEECWEVRADDGRRIALYPALGDSMEPIACEDCGAVGYGNANCETCHSHWPKHFGGACPVCKRREERIEPTRGGSVSDSITESHKDGPPLRWRFFDSGVMMRLSFSDAEPVAECQCRWRTQGDSINDAVAAWAEHVTEAHPQDI